MNQPPFDIEKAHRWFAIELNNTAWGWLEAAGADPDQIIHAAHASCFHWMQAGNPVNRIRAESLVTNAYAAAGLGEAARRHANLMLSLAEQQRDQLEDWDWPFIYDAIARAEAAAGDLDAACQARARAGQLAAELQDPEDQKVFEQWHAAGNWHGLGDAAS